MHQIKITAKYTTHTVIQSITIILIVGQSIFEQYMVIIYITLHDLHCIQMSCIYQCTDYRTAALLAVYYK